VIAFILSIYVIGQLYRGHDR